MKVSVVIPTCNGGPRFREVLTRIFSQKVDGPLEVLCVDSASTDGTAEFAADGGARVLSIRKEEFNHGLTRNRGIEASKGDLVVLAVQDALPLNADWLANLIRAVADDERAAGGYAKQVPRMDCDPIIRDRLMHWSAGRPERTVQELPGDESFDALSPLDRLALVAFDNVSSCIRRTVWEACPFEERSFGEDVAWAREVIRRGYRIIFEPAAQVEHSHNNSLWYEFKRVYADHQNLNQLVGLTTVPFFKDIFVNARHAARHYRKLIREDDVSGMKKEYRLLRAFPYAFMENLAQFLGARVSRDPEKRGSYGDLLNRWLIKGL